MKQSNSFKYKFVEYVPPTLEEGVFYISIPFATVIHKCACGCGGEVVTPLAPTEWKLIFDGETITLDPSIGNWSFNCRSHYWIKRNKIIWSSTLSQETIKSIRNQDRIIKQQYYETKNSQNEDITKQAKTKEKQGLWQKIISWWS